MQLVAGDPLTLDLSFEADQDIPNAHWEVCESRHATLASRRDITFAAGPFKQLSPAAVGAIRG